MFTTADQQALLAVREEQHARCDSTASDAVLSGGANLAKLARRGTCYRLREIRSAAFAIPHQAARASGLAQGKVAAGSLPVRARTNVAYSASWSFGGGHSEQYRDVSPLHAAARQQRQR
jgi:hypothetical protein